MPAASATLQQTTLRALARLVAIVLLCTGAGHTPADAAGANTPGALRTRYDALQDRLHHNPFQRPLALDSSEAADGVTGSIHALVDHPFATVAAALQNPGHWCDILILHLNTKYCRAATSAPGEVLNVNVGRKSDQPLDESYRVDFAFRVAARTPDYLQVRLSADTGPLGTSDYHIMLEAIPLENGRTFIHLAYSYAYGMMGRLAMQAYLGTTGRDKVGFSVTGTRADGRPLHIGGMRGAVERNTMRYYLAIEAFLGALSRPLPAQFEKRIRDWFTATERYPRQLHEMERGAYLDMKRREYRRQRANPPAEHAGRLRMTAP